MLLYFIVGMKMLMAIVSKCTKGMMSLRERLNQQARVACIIWASEHPAAKTPCISLITSIS